MLSDRKITICRELTKLHETVQLHTISSAIEFYKQNQPKGEYVLVIEGCTLQELEARHQNKWLDISIPEHMDIYLSKDMAKKEAMKQVASDRGISRREVYNSLLKQ